MYLVAALDWRHYLFMIPLMLLSIFLVLVILVQRGRGGGLTGALGGMGGQSAFGTKAGDLFTRITIVVAAIWVLLSMAALKVLNPHAVAGFDPSQRGTPTSTSKATPGLMPFSNKSVESTDAKSSESPASTSAEAPASTTSPATTEPAASPPAAAPANEKPGDAKPDDAAKP